MAKAFVFPGQGSQFVGMGKGLAGAFAEARSVFEEVDEALHKKLSALMATSLAALRVLEGELGVNLARDAAFVAGHSLGEYSALAAAGSLTVADAARLLRVRGEAMQRAVPVGEGMMAALIGLDYAAGAAIAAEAQEQAQAICAVANDNGGGQIVISGAKPAVECAIELAKTKGVRRAIPLSVSAPFHCALMAPAAKRMAEALAKIDIKKPKVPVVANVLAAPVEDPREIRERLVEQVTGTVRWRESVVFMAGRGVSEFIELGSGKVLTGLLKRIVETATGIAVGTPDEIKAYQAFC
ncbi:MAG: ACP S-malonyltransferase [Methylovirgula sp.]